MILYAAGLAAVSCLLLFAIPARSTDLKIVTRESSERGQSSTRTEYLTASSSRFESRTRVNNIAGHRIAHITHYGESANEQFVLDLDAHEYVKYDSDKRGIRLGVKGRPVKYTGGTVDIYIDSTDTGETKEMFGHSARHIFTKERRIPGLGSCSIASESESDGWYIDYSALPEWRRPKAGQFAILAGFPSGCLDKIQVHRSGVQVGFPLKMVTTVDNVSQPGQDLTVHSFTSTSEVIEFRSAHLDPTLFVVPPDFRQVKELTNMNRPGNLTAWESFKKWVGDIFR